MRAQDMLLEHLLEDTGVWGEDAKWEGSPVARHQRVWAKLLTNASH